MKTSKRLNILIYYNNVLAVLKGTFMNGVWKENVQKWQNNDLGIKENAFCNKSSILFHL